MSENTDLPPADSAGPTAGPTVPGAPPSTAGPGTPPPGAPRGLDQLWDALRRSGVRRPLDDRWLGGVCSGTARRLGVDPVLLRVALAATVLLGGVGVVAYAFALVLLPDHDGRIELERASYGDLTGTTVGAVALLLLAVVTPSPWSLVGGGDLVSGAELVGALVVGTLLLVGLALLPQLREAVERSSARSAAAAGAPQAAPRTTGSGTGYGTGYGSGYGSTYGSWDDGSAVAATVAEDVQRRYGWSGSGPASSPLSGSTVYGRPAYGPPPVPKPPRPVRAGRRGPGPAVSAAATGGALVAAGLGWAAAETGLLPGRPALLAACAALVVLGAVLVGLGVAGRRDGGVGFTTFLVLLAVVGLVLVPSWRTTQLAGERTWAPADVTEAGRGGSIGLGDGYLDLSGLTDLPAGAEVEVPVRVGIGEMTVLVPEGMDVRVEAGALVGSTVLGDDGPGEEVSGVGLSRRLLDSRDPQVVVDARALVGTVRVLEVEEP